MRCRGSESHRHLPSSFARLFRLEVPQPHLPAHFHSGTPGSEGIRFLANRIVQRVNDIPTRGETKCRSRGIDEARRKATETNNRHCPSGSY